MKKLLLAFVLFIALFSTDVEAFDWNWEYDPPTCEGLKITWPTDLPHDAIDVNIRVKDLTNDKVTTFNYRNADGFELGVEHTFKVELEYFEYQWVQVHGTNYHWEGSIVCELGKGEIVEEPPTEVEVIPEDKEEPPTEVEVTPEDKEEELPKAGIEDVGMITLSIMLMGVSLMVIGWGYNQGEEKEG